MPNSKKPSATSRLNYYLNRQCRRIKLKNISDKEKIRSEAKKPVNYASILIASRFDKYGSKSGEESINAAIKSGLKKSKTRHLAGLITWIRYGYQRQEEAIQAIINIIGNEATSLFRTAYLLGTSNGLVDENPRKADEIEKQLEITLIKNQSLHSTVLLELLDDNKQITPDDLEQLTKKLSEIVAHGFHGEEITRGGNVQQCAGRSPRRSITEIDILKRIFGNEENIAKALQPFVNAYKKEGIKEKYKCKNKQKKAKRGFSIISTNEDEDDFQTDRPPFEFSDKDVDELSLNRDLRKEINGNNRGTILLERRDKNGNRLAKPFITSAPSLLRMMYLRQEEENFIFFNTEMAGSSAHNIRSLLLDAITSLITHGEFTGRVGFVNTNGDAVWLNKYDDLPDDLLVSKSDKPWKKTISYGDAKKYSKYLNENHKKPENYSFENDQRLNKLTPVGQMWSLLKDGDLPEDVDPIQLEKFLTALKLKKIEPWLAPDLIKQWSDHIGIGGIAYYLRDGSVIEEYLKTHSSIRDGDPNYLARRDDHGIPITENFTIVASSFVGRKMADSAKPETGPLATKRVKKTEMQYKTSVSIREKTRTPLRPNLQQEKTLSDTTESAQLKLYLELYAKKNKFWEKVSKKALDNGDIKNISGALAAAKKMFGALEL